MIRRPPRSTLFPYTPLSRSFPPCLVAFVAGCACIELPSGDSSVSQRVINAYLASSRYCAGRDSSIATSGLARAPSQDRKSTRLNSSHSQISYAVFCFEKKYHVAALGAERDLAGHGEYVHAAQHPGADVFTEAHVFGCHADCPGTALRASRALRGDAQD